MYVTRPPFSSKSKKYHTPFNLYQHLTQNFKDDEVVIYIDNDNDSGIEQITKKRLDLYVRSCVNNLKSIIGNKNTVGQLKIFIAANSSLECTVLMLASGFLGAHHCICFEELSDDAIKDRLEIFKPDIRFCTQAKYELMGSSLREIAWNTIENIHEYKDNGWERTCLSDENNSIESSENYYDDDCLFTLFTSGSTGKPKAIMHSCHTFLEYAESTCRQFFLLSKGSCIFTATDSGWINGHTYALYGPLSIGASTVIIKNMARIIKLDVLRSILKSIRIDIFYTSVTTLRAIRKNAQRSSLLHLDGISQNFDIGCCGEPLAQEVANWALEFFKTKNRSIVNTYFQTETGGILTAPSLNRTYEDFRTVGTPPKELGIALAKNVLSEEELNKKQMDPNELIVTKPWNGIFKQIVSDRSTDYFTEDGYYRLSDTGFYDEQGRLYIGGRTDDVINVAGHRISTSEIESISISSYISEACVVAIPDKLLGETPAIFYSLTNNQSSDNNLIPVLSEEIRSKLSNYHQPSKYFNFPELPKTKSGKIMRRVMKHIASYWWIEGNKDFSTFTNYNQFKIELFKHIKSRFETECDEKISLRGENIDVSMQDACGIACISLIDNILFKDPLAKIDLAVVCVNNSDSSVEEEHLSISDIKQVNEISIWLKARFDYQNGNKADFYLIVKCAEAGVYIMKLNSYAKELQVCYEEYKDGFRDIFKAASREIKLARTLTSVISEQVCTRCNITLDECNRLSPQKDFFVKTVDREGNNKLMCYACFMLEGN